MAAKFGLLIDAKTKGENNIKRLGNSMQGVEGKAKNLGMAVKGVGTAFKALFAAAAVAGFSRFIKGAIDTADSFGKLEVRTGIAAEKLMAYVNAGKLADVSQKQLTTGLRTLARTQAEAADGVATYSEAYERLGVSVTRADGSLKPSDQLLGEIADKFKDLPDGPEKAAIAMDLFGKSGADMITLLNGGSEALEEFNYQLSDNFAQNAEYYNDQITRMGFAFDGFRMQLMDALMPALIQITEAFTTLFDTETDWSGLFTVIEAGIRTVAGVTFATVAAFKFFGRTLVDLVKIAERLINFDVQGAMDIAGQGLTDTREQFFKDIDQFAGIFTRSAEAPEGYGRRTASTTSNRLPTSALQSEENKQLEEKDKLLDKILGKAFKETANFMDMLKGLDDEKRMLQAKLDGKEKEVALEMEIEEKTKNMPPLIAAAVEERIRGNAVLQESIDAQEKANQVQKTQAEELNGLYKQIGSTILNNIGGAIESVIDGTKSLQESLAGILRQIGSLLINFGTNKALNTLFPSAKGNVFAQNKIVPFAYGGIVNKPTLFPMANGAGLMGEAGPEAIMPLRRGADGRLGVEASGAGMGGIVVNVDATGSTVEGDQQQSKQLGQAIGAAVQAEIIKQKMPGGLLN